MIRNISIHNYALIEKTDIELEKGFTVITGETGAGKSILLGALGLTLGQRADSSLLMDKGKKCIAEIQYDISGYPVREWFTENELDYSDVTTVRREITPEGKSRGFINDTPVNNKVLKEFGDFMIDIHSQHQSLLLGQPEYQTEILDAFCGHQDVVAAYKNTYQIRRRQFAELKKVREAAETAAKEKDYLSFQLAQLDAAQLKEGEKETLEEELALLLNAESIKSKFGILTDVIRDADHSIIQLLKSSRNQMASLKGIVKEAEEYESRLESVLLELKDIAEEAERKAEATEYNPMRIDQLNQRLSTIYDLLLKYKAETVAGLLEIRLDIEHRLQGIEAYDRQIGQLESELQVLDKQLDDWSSRLHEGREKAVPDLCACLKKLLTELGIRHAEFDVKLTPLPEYGPAGKDEIGFLFSANKNQTPGELSRVASGGEVSRVMLSLKYILSGSKRLPVVVFDEIDTGLSGEVAHKMAQMMREMAGHMQVISISHLPQIASAGDAHLKVFKEEQTDRTVSRIAALSYEDRVKEIAAMLSGSEITRAATEAAVNLLKG